MAKNAMPVSKAKTAYGLLSEIKRIILRSPDQYDQQNCHRESECGTVCCVGGWVTMLKSPRTRDGYRLQKAERILGLDYRKGNELWFWGAAGSRFDPIEHAKRGAEHIASFQKKYAAQLKARRV